MAQKVQKKTTEKQVKMNISTKSPFFLNHLKQSFLKILSSFKLWEFRTKICAVITTILALIGISVATFYLNMPTNALSGSVQNPSVSGILENKITLSPFFITFPAPIAKLELVGKEIQTPIKIFPAIAGKWTWQNQTTLSFMPDVDWAPNTTYTVTLPKDIFDATYQIKPLEYKVKTPAFTGSFAQTEFYEDPQNPKTKRITATLHFSHPVDVESLKNNLKATTASGASYGFTVTPADMNRTIYVVTSPVKIGSQEDFLSFYLKKTSNMYNKEKLDAPIETKVTIPSSSTFFKVNSVHSNIILNQEKNNDAEQILFVDFKAAVSTTALADYFKLYQYQGECYRFNESYKKLKDKDASPLMIEGVKTLEYTSLPLENNTSKIHTFKYAIKNPKNVCLIVEIKRGLSSQDDFVLGETYIQTLPVAHFPTEVKIAFDGSLLSLTGDKRLAFVTRGLQKVKSTVSRIPTNAINHLVSQTSGSFTNPTFYNYAFNADNIAENFEETIMLNAQSPEKQNYASIDLNKYFQDKKGIFIAKMEGFKQSDSYSSAQDTRLVMLTNIGIIAKNNKDRTRTVFVSNFASQKPLQGAKVEILGKNGVPILNATSNKEGLVTFPDLSDFAREKEPTAYVVTYGEDVSFMPIDRYDRQINYARFDVGGVYAPNDGESLKAYIFSDRGIYRPDETAYFGVIVKDATLKTPVQNTVKIEIRDPYGDNVFTHKYKVPESGLFDFSFKTKTLSKTGIYTASVSFSKDGMSYYTIGDTTIKVEEFAPETMRIKATIADTSKQSTVPLNGWITSSDIEANVTLENLYGNPADNHVVKGEVYLIPTNFKFAPYENYIFDDPLRTPSQTPLNIHEKMADKTTNAQGIATFNIDLNQYTKGTYRLLFKTEGLEATGGRSVSTQTTALVSPLKTLVGYKKDGDFNYISKDANRSVEFIVLDSDLNQVSLNQIRVEIFEKKYISTLVKQPNGTFKYQSVEKNEKVSDAQIDIPQTGLKYTLDTSTAGQYFVQLADKDGAILSRIHYAVAGGSNASYSLEKSAELIVKLNKAQYNHGEEIEMQITTPYTGYGLITIEKDNVFAQEWFKTDTLSTTQRIILPASVEGNAYINVAFIRELGSKEIFMSPLSFAATPFSISKEKRVIQIDLQTPKLVKPSEKLTVTYKADQKGKIIIFGVNEGILSYAKYKTPDPLMAFMPKQALQVMTYQIMDLILPDAGHLRNLSSTGGDMEMDDILGANLNPFARKFDKPVAFWSGVMDVDTVAKTYTYTVPDNFNGQIRVMAVSVNDTSFGSTQKMVTVRGDFAMTPSAPFNVNPNDIFEVGTSVANMVEKSKSLDTTVSLHVSDNFEIMGDKEQIATLSENMEKSFKFKVKAKEDLGDGTLTFVAKSGMYASTMTIRTGVRPAMPYATEIKSGYVKKSVTLKDFNLNLYSQHQTKQITASTSPLVLTSGLVKYLDAYPFGCTEQTISRVFPMITLLFNHPNVVKGVNVYDLFDQAISTLKTRQTNNGGFTPWTTAGGIPDDFASIYAYHFLMYAADRDFDVPDMMIKRAAGYMKEIARSTPKTEEQKQNIAYAIYVLTLNGEVTTNYLINLESVLSQDKNWKKSLAAAYIGASYKLLKNDIKADEIIGRYKLGQDVTQDARYIYLMASHFPEEFSKIKEQGIDILLQPLKEGRVNSISSAYSILALGAYPKTQGADTSIKFSVGTPTYGDFTVLDFAQIDKGTPIKISSDTPFYYTITQQGFAKDLPQKAIAQDIEVVKEIQNAKGQPVAHVKLGDEVMIKLRLKSNSAPYISDVALVDLIPGCFEIIPTSVQSEELDSFEVREDRAIFYLTARKTMAEISYKAKVIAQGEFIIPPTTASALYDVDVRANTAVGTIKADE